MKSLLFLFLLSISVDSFVGYSEIPPSLLKHLTYVRRSYPVLFDSRNPEHYELYRKILTGEIKYDPADDAKEEAGNEVEEKKEIVEEKKEDSTEVASGEVVEEAEIECNKGHFMNAMTKECEECTPCAAGQYMTSGCEGKEDTVCGSCDIPDKKSDSYWYSCDHIVDGKIIHMKDWRKGFVEKEDGRKEDSYEFFELFESYVRQIILGERVTDDQRQQMNKFSEENIFKILSVEGMASPRVGLDSPKWKNARIEDSVLFDSQEIDEYSDDPFENFEKQRRIFLERKEKDAFPVDSSEEDEDTFLEDSSEEGMLNMSDEEDSEEDFYMTILNESWEDDEESEEGVDESDEEEEEEVEKKQNNKQRKSISDSDEQRLREIIGRHFRPRQVVVVGAEKDKTPLTASLYPNPKTGHALKNAIILCCIALALVAVYQLAVLPCIRRRQVSIVVPPMCEHHQNLVNTAYERLKEEKALPADI